jgi:hypothetical protein
LKDGEFKEWVTKERKKVEFYLSKHGIENPNVGPRPAFEIAPHFAIWAVESKQISGKIGWWAFSGDCPTDYVSEDGKCHPRNALKLLLDNWRIFIPNMKKGKQPPNVQFADGADLPLLGELLEKRVTILDEWLSNDDLWEDQ